LNVGHSHNAADYGSSSSIPSRYGNNHVQITSSRITTDRNGDHGGHVSGGNVISSSSRREVSGGSGATGVTVTGSNGIMVSGANGTITNGLSAATGTTSTGKYQFYQSKYDKK
jgi:hypothetical protein